MRIFVNILIILTWLVLILMKALPLDNFYISEFEQRRHFKENKSDIKFRVASRFLQLKIFLHIKTAILILFLGLLLVWHRAGWVAFITGLILLILVFLLANLQFVRRLSEKLFWLLAEYILKVVNFISPALKLMSPEKTRKLVFGSKEELLDILKHNMSGLTVHDNILISQVLTYPDKKVKDLMIKRPKIIAVKSSDLLGPKLVDQLHASGHQIFPVFQGSIDSPIGSLYLSDIADVKVLADSPKVHNLARKQTFYLHQHDSLEAALQACLVTGVQQFMVIDNKQKVRGLICLKDILGSLFETEGGEHSSHFDDPNEVVLDQLSQND